MSRLLDAAGEAPFVFVTGKGGTGKSTAACALALEFADGHVPTHLISTDPAHSIGDVFRQPVGGGIAVSDCSQHLRLEELDAARASEQWLARALVPVSALVESGTYLDGDDVAAFSRLALPGIDEMMAVLRLAELAERNVTAGRVVVDTAPTGHTLRLLDAADVHEGIAHALRAMADKAAAVAGALTGRSVRMQGEEIIDELERTVRTYREGVLRRAAFVVTTRAGAVVHAETRRLLAALEHRGLRAVAVVAAGGGSAGAGPSAVAQLGVPILADATGCNGLREWRSKVVPDGPGATRGPGPGAGSAAASNAGPAGSRADDGTGRNATQGPGPGTADAVRWLEANARRLLLFAGKGGVGKSTCAAAAATALAGSRNVLLCSTDPAGSLADVLGTTAAEPLPRLRVQQIDPEAQLGRLHDAWEEEVLSALEQVGLSGAAALDRRVIDSLWHLAPPGVDELAATAAMLSAAHSGETVVIDSAPTGHFLRLLEMPEVALGWTRQLMRVFVKYGIAGVAGGAAEALLELSRELRSLRDTLREPGSASVIIVSLEEPVVVAETQRLVAALADSGVSVAAELLNRASAVRAQVNGSSRDSAECDTRIYAPELSRPPVGVAALRDFVDTWKIVA